VSRKSHELERQSRRDVAIVHRKYKQTGGYAIADLHLLQRAHQRLLELQIAEANRCLEQPLLEGWRHRQPDGPLQVRFPLPRYLYHGTKRGSVSSILSEGIKPRGSRPPNHPTAPSHPNCVYLSDGDALSYTLEPYSESGGAVFEIERDLLTSDLLPDEDALGPWQDPRGLLETAAEGEGFGWNVLFRSLFQHGSVAHRGTIPLLAIRRVALLPNTWVNLTMAQWEDKHEQAAIRAQQKLILAWVFDGGNSPFPIAAEELVFNSQLSAARAEVQVNSEFQAQLLTAAGITADTLWRMYFLTHPQELNRKGIEVLILNDRSSKQATAQGLLFDGVATCRP
jgi:hypothetical protein